MKCNFRYLARVLLAGGWLLQLLLCLVALPAQGYSSDPHLFENREAQLHRHGVARVVAAATPLQLVQIIGLPLLGCNDRAAAAAPGDRHRCFPSGGIEFGGAVGFRFRYDAHGGPPAVFSQAEIMRLPYSAGSSL
uniref:Uncharacterized protein n=1 Tax=Anopheles coluzzii TaxID=1518534 RepID=A0A8W7PZ77_ANOCL